MNYKEIDATAITEINIEGNEIFQIDIETVATKYISFESIVDGEYENEFQVVSAVVGNKINLKLEQYSYAFIKDDKRNAHKIVAAKLILKVPEKLNLNVISDISNVTLKGKFDALDIRLQEGYFKILGEVSEANVSTINGSIVVRTRNARINANSSNGELELAQFTNPRSTFNLKTVNGNISVSKME
ncbi:hypothetical protein [Winogradskyella poriferorum]|uniref:hypothetical protein n=1 Tax=Winogradskyella poriferorum TaxID=307627 RepID=UPI003D647206